ncbi:STAS domain-containing protein [Methylocella sp.]|uniref:STAS domain-containing protein n=1 Tax=Methylocella sp. TaxID=1978226 RepID=UPI003784ECF1
MTVIRQAAAPGNQSEAPPSAQIVELAATLDLMAAAPLAAELLAARGAELLIDGSRVERLGGLCLQALLSAAATWRADGARLALVDASPEMLEAFACFGVDPDDLDSRETRI